MTNSFQAAFRLLPYISYSFRPIPNSFRTAYWHNLIVFPTVNTNSNMIKTFFDLFWIVLSNKVGHLLSEPGFDPHSTPRFRRIISDVEFYVTNSLERCRKIQHGKFRHTNPTVDDQPQWLLQNWAIFILQKNHYKSLELLPICPISDC